MQCNTAYKQITKHCKLTQRHCNALHCEELSLSLSCLSKTHNLWLCPQFVSRFINSFFSLFFSDRIFHSFKFFNFLKFFNTFCSFLFICKAKIHKFTPFFHKIHKFSFLLWIASAFATPRNDGVAKIHKIYSKIQKIHSFHNFFSNFHSKRFQNFEKFNKRSSL